MEIEVAAYGWQGSEWNPFYPDGLPADWRLDYYANEFFAVVVPFAEWSVAEDAELLAWQDQVSDDFRFYWEQAEGVAGSEARLQQLRANEEFAAHWGGVVVLERYVQGSHSTSSQQKRALLRLCQTMALRPLREAIEQAMATGGTRLLVIVEAGAQESLRTARDLAQLLEGS